MAEGRITRDRASRFGDNGLAFTKLCNPDGEVVRLGRVKAVIAAKRRKAQPPRKEVT